MALHVINSSTIGGFCSLSADEGAEFVDMFDPKWAKERNIEGIASW